MPGSGGTGVRERVDRVVQVAVIRSEPDGDAAVQHGDDRRTAGREAHISHVVVDNPPVRLRQQAHVGCVDLDAVAKQRPVAEVADVPQVLDTGEGNALVFDVSLSDVARRHHVVPLGESIGLLETANGRRRKHEGASQADWRPSALPG